MKTLFTTREISPHVSFGAIRGMIIAMLALACASPAAAQKDKKKKSEPKNPRTAPTRWFPCPMKTRSIT